MKINFDSKLMGLDGKALVFIEGDTRRDMLLKDAAVEALMLQLVHENSSGEEKLRRYELARKIYDGGELDLTPEDVSLIKQRIGAGYSVAVVGSAFTLLNG